MPSDNVPRRPSRSDSGEFAPPSSEDPRLAVSVAYAFADERTGRRQSPSGLHETVDVDSPHTEPSAERPDAGESADADDAPADGFEVEVSESTDREGELVADGDAEPDTQERFRARESDGENDRTQVEEADDDEVARRRTRAANRARQPVSGLGPDSSSTLDYPLLEDDDDYDDGFEGEQRRRDGAPDPAAPELLSNRADSVEIPIEEVLDGGSGRVSDGSGPFAAVRDALRATGGLDAEVPPDARSGDGAGPAGKRGGQSDGTPRQVQRAQTMALSDADIEELDEDGSPSADAGWSMPGMPIIEWTGDGPSDDSPEESPGHAFGPSLGGSPAPVHVPGPPEERDESHQSQTQGASAAARGGVVRPMTNRDPGDSGEIIDDELIEEIEEAQRAAPIESPRPTVPPPGLDIDSTLDLDGDEVEELADDPRETGPRLLGAADPSFSRHAPTGPGAAQHAKPPPAPSATRAAAAAAAAAAADPSQAKPRRRRGKPWFEDIFDEDYLRTLPFLTPQATQMEAQFVMDALAIAAGSQVLDVGCGYGRHAMELAARGYHVVGLDSSLPLLLRGADEAQRRGLTINFVHGDMRDMAFDAQFDGAYCLFSTFGYFDDETNKKTAQNICRALKPGARCVFEVLNRDYIIAELPLRVWWEGDGCVVLEEVDFNYFSSRLISNRSVVFDDGRQLEQEISIRSFGLHELGKLLHSAGFRVVEVSGNMITKGRYFGAQSRDIVVIAERRIEKPGSPNDGGQRIP